MTDSPTALDFLREMLAERRNAEAKVLRLRDQVSRPEFRLTFRVPTDAGETAEIFKRAEAEESKQDAPPGALIVACMTIARFCVQIEAKGKKMSSGDGSAFADPGLQEALGATSAWVAVRRLFDDDFAVTRMYQALMREAGLSGSSGVAVEDSDPT